MYKSPTRRNAWPFAGFWLALALVAAPAPAQQQPLPIGVEANNADLSRESGVSTYSGNVVLTRGGLTLTGAKLVITRINDRGRIRAELSGSPARMDKQPDREGNEAVTGHASRIEYSNNDATIVLRGDAVVERGGDRVDGQVIRHNIDTERTQAEAGEGGSGRVRITIQPQSGAGDE